MYLAHFGLRERPFTLLPDPAFLLLTRQHDMALTLLEYGLSSDAMIAVLTGDVGSGKTTVVRYLLERMPDAIIVGLVNATPDPGTSLLHWVAVALGVPTASLDSAATYRALTDFVIAHYAHGRRVLLVLDEAQNLDNQQLEQLRLLTNLNADKDLVLQLLLVGQPELRDSLADPALRQFLQRVSVDYHLSPLDCAETLQYVRHRLEVAGGRGDIISEQAVTVAHESSQGVPRLINQLCDLALVYGFAESRTGVDRLLMEQVVRDRLAGGLFPGLQLPEGGSAPGAEERLP
jgi:type II secretory pathway predicted ATPase ExeA